MSLRPSVPSSHDVLPTEDDVQLALEGDKPARKRIKQQRFRFKKRNREIDKWDVDQAEAM